MPWMPSGRQRTEGGARWRCRLVAALPADTPPARPPASDPCWLAGQLAPTAPSHDHCRAARRPCSAYGEEPRPGRRQVRGWWGGLSAPVGTFCSQHSTTTQYHCQPVSPLLLGLIGRSVCPCRLQVTRRCRWGQLRDGRRLASRRRCRGPPGAGHGRPGLWQRRWRGWRPG
jgi:hypothetical protein